MSLSMALRGFIIGNLPDLKVSNWFFSHSDTHRHTYIYVLEININCSINTYYFLDLQWNASDEDGAHAALLLVKQQGIGQLVLDLALESIWTALRWAKLCKSCLSKCAQFFFEFKMLATKYVSLNDF